MAVTAALGLFVVLGIAALAVDFGMLVAAHTQLGTAADAGALAGAKELPFGSRDRARLRASEYAGRNRALGDTVEVDIQGGNERGDVVLGFYSLADRSFRPDNLLPNAVEVTARRTAERGNGVPTFFSSIFGRRLIDVSARSIAMGFPRRVILAIDASGSMGEDPRCNGVPGNPAIRPTREAAASFLADLGLSTLDEEAGVLSFASQPLVRARLTRLHDAGQPLDLIERTRAIEALPCGRDAGTNTGGAIEKAIEMFRDADPSPFPLGQRMLILLSDGLANRGRNGEDVFGTSQGQPGNPAWRYAVESAAEAHARRIVVHTITLGDNGQRQQMEEIAEAGGGIALFAPTPEELDQMFETLGRIVQVALVD